MPEWAIRIRRLIARHGDSQQSFAMRLGVSPATISRWINGKNEPTADMYVALGNLLGNPDGCYFWERAGIECFGAPADTMRRELASHALSSGDYHLIENHRVSRKVSTEETIIAIPLLNVAVYADEDAPAQNVCLSEAEVEDVLTAPEDWCQHPGDMIAMRVSGDSMFPTIPSGAIVMIDTARNRREELDRKIVVVAHRDQGFKVARMQRIEHTHLLVSANHRCLPVDITNSTQWKVLGEVLWWIAHDRFPESL